MKTKNNNNRIIELENEIERLNRLLYKKETVALINQFYLQVAAEMLGYDSFFDFKKSLCV